MGKSSENIRNLGLKTRFIIKAHILNPLWQSREKRRRHRLIAFTEYLQSYLEIYKDEIRSYNPEIQQEGEEPEKAFTIWFQGEYRAPKIVKACLRSMRTNLPQELIVIDESSIFDWISLPHYIIEKWRSGKIGPAHFSDICRVELLYRYGGLWFDATDFVTEPVPSEIMNEGFFVFMAGEKIVGWHGYIQNCFIRAKKGNPLLALWRKAIHVYWLHEDRAKNYFIHQILFRFVTRINPVGRQLLANMTKIDQDPTHVVWYGHRNDFYSADKYKQLTKGVFFQKTNYKDKESATPQMGTIADYMINQAGSPGIWNA